MEKLLGVEEICDILDISRTTLYRYRKDGMPYIRIRGKVQFDIDEVKRWLEKYKK